MLEGLLQGLAGAAFGSVLAAARQRRLDRGRAQVPVDGRTAAASSSPTAIRSRVVIFMVLLGAFVGAVGSATAASRFLDV